MAFLRPATDHPFGFRPYDRVLSIGAYYKDASAAAIYPGDTVLMETDGGIGVGTGSSTELIGVAAEYSPASTLKADFLVYDHPDQLYAVQDDSDTTPMTQSAGPFGNTAIITTTGDTTTLLSKQEIDSSGITTTNTLPVKVLYLHPIENGSYATVAGQQRTWVVKLNNHVFGQIHVGLA